MRPSGDLHATKPGRFGAHSPSTPVPSGNSPWIDQLLAHFVRVGTRPDGGERLVESSDAVLTALRQAVEGGRWPAALELARVAEPAFEMGARWGAWASALEMGLFAARAVGDRSAEGWALHEQGVRAIAVGSFDEAGELLSRALAIRTDVGDDEAARLTRSQLAHLTAFTATTG